MWYSYAETVFEVFTLFLLLYCLIGFIVYGRYIITMTWASNNKGSDSSAVPIKATIFLIGCILLILPLVVTTALSALGVIFQNVFGITVIWLGLSMVILVLFFKWVEKPKKLTRAVIGEENLPAESDSMQDRTRILRTAL